MTHLHRDEPVIDLHLFSKKVCSDGSFVLAGEFLVYVLVHEGSLPDTRVTCILLQHVWMKHRIPKDDVLLNDQPSSALDTSTEVVSRLAQAEFTTNVSP